jgi:translation initiation factor IF-2
MSRAQRREALSVPIDLQYRDGPARAPGGGRGGGGGGRGGGEGGGAGFRAGGSAAESVDAAAAAMRDRPGVVIGGGAGLQARHQPRAQSARQEQGPRPSSSSLSSQQQQQQQEAGPNR